MSPTRLIPGLALSAAVAGLAIGAQALETRLFGRAWLEALVLAILIGTAVRSVWTPGARWSAGIGFSAKTVLEIAVALLGAGVSAGALLGVGPALLAGIAAIVAAAIAASYLLGRALKLPPKLAALVACGNSICGNSAIAAVAPVIGAEAEEVSASIAFTAVLGVVVVLALPLAGAALGLSTRSYGIFAGLTVYAVPQVLAATAPAGALATQLGALVKLVRVLMLGPVIFAIAWIMRRFRKAPPDEPSAVQLGAGRLAPWFILTFLALMGLRSAGLIPQALLAPVGYATQAATVVSMAALGLIVDVRAVARSGLRVTAAATLSLVLLAGFAFVLIRMLSLP
jgi:uncharacterized integral membrane protein (TIGR00698 family)